jgi:hypothetical protein
MTATAVNKVRSVSAARLPPIHSGERRLPGVCTPRHLFYKASTCVFRELSMDHVVPEHQTIAFVHVQVAKSELIRDVQRPVVPQNVVRREM